MDKGLLFNIKNLVLNPRKLISDYILGKRRGILNPISFLIISITIYLVFESLIGFKGLENKDEAITNTEVYAIGKASGGCIRVYAKYFWILSVLPLALSTKLVFQKYNYIEHVAISAFIIGQATLAGLLGFLVYQPLLIFNPLLFFVILWMIYRIFSTSTDKIESSLISFAAFLLFITQLAIIIFLIGKMRV